jgi:uncharacterized protein YceK
MNRRHELRNRVGRLLVGSLLLFFVGSSSGCLTIVDTTGVHMDGPRVYGGVRLHCTYVFDHSPEVYWWPLWIPFLLVDVPLSAVADTLILPYTVPCEKKHPEK